jgi:putative flippase GtrA
MIQKLLNYKFMQRPFIQKLLNRETISYLIFGVFTTLVDLCSYWLLTNAGAAVGLSNTISSTLAIIFAFVTNKIFVFQFNSWKPLTFLRELVSFFAGRLATMLMATGLLMLLVDYWGLPNLPCKCFTLVLVTICNYFVSKWAVFRKKRSKDAIGNETNVNH